MRTYAAVLVLALSANPLVQSQPAGQQQDATAQPAKADLQQPAASSNQPAAPSQADTPALPAQSQRLLFMRRVWTLGATMQYACFEIMQDGSYRFERDSNAANARATAKLHAGKLTDRDFEAFQKVLDAPALKSLALPPIPPQKRPLTSGIVSLDVLTVNIHRSDGVQRLFFDDTTRQQRDASASFPDSYNTPAMQPLLEWYDRFGKRQDDVVAATTAKCAQRLRE